MQFKDYYQTLGVSRAATIDEIKKAFRKLARKYHPDVSKEADAEQRMREINEAYTVLSDPEKRTAYDQLGSNYQPGQEFHPPPGWDAGFEFSSHGFSPSEAADFSDFFAELFGSMGGRHANYRTAGGHFQMMGEDHHAKIYLDLEDAFTGPTRTISLRTPKQDAQGRIQLITRTLNVKIPRGVYEGQIIRLAGQGAPGMGGASAGDLLLEVHFQPHPRFRVEQRNLHLTLPLAPWEAALGTVLDVNLPESNLRVRIPPGAQSGKQLRVRGKGIPGNIPGDLLLDLQVVLPPADTPKAQQVYENMAKELAFNPRHNKG